MFTLIFLGALITVLIGVSAKFYQDWRQSRYRICGKEFAVAMGVMLVIVIPLTSWIGIKVAIHNQVTFYENHTGWELGTRLVRERTHEDGTMRHYWLETRMEWVTVTKTRTVVRDGKTTTETYTDRELRPVTHKIPYTTEEWTLVVETSFGDQVIAQSFLPENPDQYRYRRWTAVKSYPDSTGYHPFWLEARDRIARGDPGPVTVRASYDNYILASQSSILREFNDSIERYKSENLFPAINSSIRSFYFNDRVYFVGAHPAGDWQPAINRFNAALGSLLQGDLHLVIVDAKKVTDRHNYAGALRAYWLSPEFGKNAFAKNGILLVLGTSDGTTIDWAKASTGMPLGNEDMLVELESKLKGQELSPDNLLGRPSAKVSGKSVTVSTSSSLLESIILEGNNKFSRVRMGDHDGKIGFAYLLRELEPTTGQKVVILVIIGFFASVAWAVCIRFGPDDYKQLWREIRDSIFRNRRRRF